MHRRPLPLLCFLYAFAGGDVAQATAPIGHADRAARQTAHSKHAAKAVEARAPDSALAPAPLPLPPPSAGPFDDNGQDEGATDLVPGAAATPGDATGGAHTPSPPLPPPPPLANIASAAPAAPPPVPGSLTARLQLWHDTPAMPGSNGSNFGQLALNSGGTIVASRPSSSTAQAGAHLRLAHFVHKNVFVAGDVELGGGMGTAAYVNRLFLNAGAALGLYRPLHKKLDLLPSVGLGYNLWLVRVGRGAGWQKHALQADFRLALASPLTERWSLVLTPYLQTNLVHGGSGPPDGPHVSLGLSAGMLAWL